MSETKRIFISYKRNVQPDDRIALTVYERLSKYHDVFIDKTMIVGTRWGDKIEENLQATDFFIPFISKSSVGSDMVVGEIATAHYLYKARGKPITLPVNLNYDEPLSYPLSAYLNPINYVLWKTEMDTSKVLRELELAIDQESLSSDHIVENAADKARDLFEKIKHFLSVADYREALAECEKALSVNPMNSAINMLLAVALLRRKGADQLSPVAMKRVEACLNTACLDAETKPTALVIWALIKFDYLSVSRSYPEHPSIAELKSQIQQSDLTLVNREVVGMIRVSKRAYKMFGLVENAYG